MEIYEILPKLKGVRRAGQGKWSAQCCAHDDRKPSLSIRDVGNGRILLNCFAGCSYESILLALGLDPKHRQSYYVPPQPIRKAIEDKPIDARGIWQRWFDATEFGYMDAFGILLGVDTDALRSIGCAWAEPHNAWAFPMKDAGGKVIGIRLRNMQGHKWAVKGSRQGLFIPTDYPFGSDGTLWICEGPTDLAAALTLGLVAIARPACLGQETMLIEYIRAQRVKRVVIVTDNDDPGLRGAAKLQGSLPVLSCVWIPPCKDIREFLNRGGDRRMIEASISDLVWVRPTFGRQAA